MPKQLGQIRVHGLSLRELSGQLAARFAGATGKPPTVRVACVRSRQNVVAARQAPGLVAAKGPSSLMEVVARAGSPTAA